ncbi:MAG: amino acid permease [Acidobacteria bacterium]|nr:MAG: amino acid permease [Acidobacteriota bacterium]REK02219.1 MAG: amino acid permease [Acidobacteriota bacterium]REK13978.1 MAG: amino acid permease [Acidobacteriota bacterium]REK41973.1 MAG: amino acid permease [Acidobacteriota bacterium]
MREEKLVRGIGRWDLIAIAVNTVVGAGIFGLPSEVARLIGSYSIIAFFACSIVIALFTLCFAEVSSRFRTTGGSYLYARRAFGSFVGFEAGWLFWITRLTAFGANGNVLVSYLGYFYEPVTEGVLRVLILALIVIAFGWINIVGVKQSVLATNILTIGKLTPLLFFVVAGIFFIEPGAFTFGEMPEISAFGTAVLVLLYAFVGFESAVIPAGELKDPERNAPFGLLTAIGIIVALYILIQVVAMGTLPELAGSRRPLADSAEMFLGSFGAGLIAIGAIISILGNLNVGLLSASRLLFAISEQKDLPYFISRTHEKFRTPHIAVAATSTIVFIFGAMSTFVSALTISTVTRLCVYALTFAALPIFRRRRELTDAQGYSVPGGDILAVVSIALIACLFFFVNLADLVQLAAVSVLGAVLYFANKIFSNKDSGDEA